MLDKNKLETQNARVSELAACGNYMALDYAVIITSKVVQRNCG